MALKNGIFGLIRFFSAVAHTLYHSWLKMRWSPSSKKWLILLDEKIRTFITHKHHAKWVKIKHDGEILAIWTVVVEGELRGTLPLVAIHGMGGGGNLFIKNIDSFAEQVKNKRYKLNCTDSLTIGSVIVITHKHHAKWVKIKHDGEILAIWTVVVEGELRGTLPLVAIHGMGGGGNLFIKNIDSFAEQRKVYLLDMPGFGLSSRPELDVKRSSDGTISKTNANDIEKFYTQTLEKWMVAMDLDKIILLGHSYGAYISSIYAMAFPSRVQHLILADPWGVPPRPEKPPVIKSRRRRILLYIVGKLNSRMNIFTPIRALGPLGPTVFWSVRSDLHRRYALGSKEDTTFFQYLYACNTADSPSGEIGFSKLCIPVGYACKPILERMDDWSPDLGVTFVYGEKSWVDHRTGFKAKEKRSKGYVDVQIVKDAGHHVHSDQSDVFNHVVRVIAEAVDKGIKPSITEYDLIRDGLRIDE